MASVGRRKLSKTGSAVMQRSFAEGITDTGRVGGGGGLPRSSPQVAALGDWLLDVAGALLDPTDRPLTVVVAVAPPPGLQSDGGWSSSPDGCSAHVGGRAAHADCAVVGKRDSDVLGSTWRRGLTAGQRFAYFERKVGPDGPILGCRIFRDSSLGYNFRVRLSLMLMFRLGSRPGGRVGGPGLAREAV